jgi:hypothetical protein
MIRTRIAIFIAVAIALSACCRSAMARELWIEHVTVVSAERSSPLRVATVVVRDERIASVAASGPPRESGSDVEIIDGTDLFLSPGLIDSHVHTNELAGMVQSMAGRFPVVARALREQLPRSYLYFGFTTLVDAISTPEHMREWNAYPVHPDLYFCGPRRFLAAIPRRIQRRRSRPGPIPTCSWREAPQRRQS